MARFVTKVPGDAHLVVRTGRGTKVLYAVLLGAVALQVGVVAAVVVIAVWISSPVPLLILAMFTPVLIPLWLVVREYQGLLGPQLAADHHGVWIRTGVGPRPEVVHLPWSAIDGIDTARKGPVVRIMSRQGEALFGNRPHWRVRSLQRRFGTAFVVDGQRSAEPPDQIAHRLRQLAEWASRLT